MDLGVGWGLRLCIPDKLSCDLKLLILKSHLQQQCSREVFSNSNTGASLQTLWSRKTWTPSANYDSSSPQVVPMQSVQQAHFLHPCSDTKPKPGDFVLLSYWSKWGIAGIWPWSVAISSRLNIPSREKALKSQDS